MRFFQKNRAILIALIIIVLTGAYFFFEKIAYANNETDEVIFQDNEVLQEDGMLKDKEILQNDEAKGTDDGNDNLSEGDLNENSIEEADKEKIYVYVTGEVNNSGVVILDEGSRISNAIDAAGGITVNANISKINLVYVLEDGMKVSIPSNEEIKQDDNFQYVTLNFSDDTNGSITNSSTSATKTSSSSSNSSSKGKIEKVNINFATQTELETLPGIGPSLALKIISFRNENGRFSSIEDIKNVSGIANSKFNNIKEYITV